MNNNNQLLYKSVYNPQTQAETGKGFAPIYTTQTSPSLINQPNSNKFCTTGVSNIVESKPSIRKISTVLNLKKNFLNKNKKPIQSAFSVVSNSSQVLEAVTAFKQLSISCKEFKLDNKEPVLPKTLGDKQELKEIPKMNFLKRKKQKCSMDSSNSLSTSNSSMSVNLPDGAEATDIYGIRAFESTPSVLEESKELDIPVLSPKCKASPYLRKDVVWKSLLRAMKKYYSKEFREYFNYSDPKFIRRGDLKQMAFTHAKQFLEQSFTFEAPENTAHFLFALVDIKGRLYEENAAFPQLERDIKDLLRSFTSKKLKDLLRFHQFSSLILHFLVQNSEISELISKSKGDAITKDAFQRYTVSLRTLVESYL